MKNTNSLIIFGLNEDFLYKSLMKIKYDVYHDHGIEYNGVRIFREGIYRDNEFLRWQKRN